MTQNFANLYPTLAPNGTHPGPNGMPRPSPSAVINLPTSQIEMTVSCRNLLNRDITSKSDPFCVIKMKEAWQDGYQEIGRTEKISDNLNPEWVKKFIINYSFEAIQKMRFEVWDADPTKDEFLGQCQTTLAEVVAFASRQFMGPLTGVSSRNSGQIILVTEEVSSCKKTVEMQFAAKNLVKKLWFCANDPFLVFSRSNEDGTHSVVYKSEIGHSQNHQWKPMHIHARTLCNGDFDRTIKIDCYDHRSDGDHKLIGTGFTTLNALSHGVCEENELLLRHEVKQKEDRGILALVAIRISEEISFLDYIRGGTQMHFAVAIDFTASNGSPLDVGSLHYFDTQRPNHYEMALRSVGDIIQPYDSAQLFPAFGFGAKIPPNFDISHQFPLNGDAGHPYCTSVDEILLHYRTCLNTIQFYGPTNFSPVITNTIQIAKRYQDGKHYFVLLIITDGIISDMQNTKRAIITASSLPISIIIVGVGNAEFDAMDELDSDGKRLRYGKQVAERDIVQFVPMNRFTGNNGSFVRSQADLAREVLAEVPAQMTGYMKKHGHSLATPAHQRNEHNGDQPSASAPVM